MASATRGRNPKAVKQAAGKTASRAAKGPASKSAKKAPEKSTRKPAARAASEAPAPTPPAKRARSTRRGKASAKSAGRQTAGKPARVVPPAAPGEPVLLSGGNPRIAKGYGDAPVQAYLAAMPGWKSAAGRRLDALIERAVPGVRKAVKWNSPFYGSPESEGDWFLSFHCFTRYIKIAFFRGASLRPVPPGASKQPAVRYLDLHEHDALDEAQFVEWVKQACRLPGERM